MIDPWRHVDADDELVADLLAGTVELVLELGGWVHPAARFVARDGQLGVTCPAPQGEVLISLPRSAFIRIGQVPWSADDDRLAYESVPDGFTGAELELLILQSTLHNACAKIPWLAATHPVLAPELTPEMITAVRAFRPSFRRRLPSPAALFWSNRAFRVPMGDDAVAEAVAMPLVDLLNHDQRGATPTWTGEAFEVPIVRADGSDECLLDYGLERDAIGMAVVYGFADGSSRVAHSAPLEVPVPDVGIVTVAAVGRTRSAELLPPVVLAVDGDVTTLSHLTYRPGGFDAAVGDVRRPTGWSYDASARVVTAVAGANEDLARHLVEATSVLPDSPAAQTLGAAAGRYASVLSAGLAGGPVTESSSSSDSSGIRGSG